MKKHLVLIILIAVFLILSIVFVVLIKTGKLTNLAATNNAILSLSPAGGNYIIGNNFTLNIIIDTGGQATSGTDIYLNYNPQDLKVIDADLVTPGVQIQAGNLYSQKLWNSVNETTGKIVFSTSVNTGEPSYNGTGTVASVTFQPLRTASPTPVTFDFIAVGATNDSNVTLAGIATDILGSVANGSYNLAPPDVPTTVRIQLEARPGKAATSDTAIEVRNVDQAPIIFQKTNLITDANGTGTLTISGLSAGNYDFKIKANHWLYKTLANLPISSPLTLDFGILKGGDLLVDNQINGGDFTYLKQKFMTNDAVADINQDGIVNTIDFSVIYTNWGLNGQ